jgi:hypothetical protein
VVSLDQDVVIGNARGEKKYLMIPNREEIQTEEIKDIKIIHKIVERTQTIIDSFIFNIRKLILILITY